VRTAQAGDSIAQGVGGGDGRGSSSCKLCRELQRLPEEATMLIGVPSETWPGETRVAATADAQALT